MTAPEPPAPPPAAPIPPPAAPPAPPPSDRTFTQDEVNAIAAKQKDEGRTAALAAVQKDLGVDIDAAKAVLKAAKERADADKTEAQLAREAADTEKAAAEKDKLTAAQATLEAHLARAFVLAGQTDPVKIERYSRLVDVNPGAKFETVQKAVEEIRASEPAMFGPALPGRPPAPGGDPKGTPVRNPTAGEDRFAQGAALASRYNGSRYSANWGRAQQQAKT